MPRKSNYEVWYEAVKRELLLCEPQNILARADASETIINSCMNCLNGDLKLPLVDTINLNEYVCTVKPQQHLTFLLNWPGLRIDNSPKAPKSKKEYVKKSKNWLNGRRAPNYGKTLFPFFITDAEEYILNIAKILFPSHTNKQQLYFNILIYKILAKLCGCTVSLHEQAKKAPFFCKNSIERKGKLKQILQRYASDHPYIQGFPSCFEAAIGYFDNKSNEYMAQYKKQYTEDHGHNNNMQSPCPQHHIFIKQEQDVKDTQNIDYWKEKVQELQKQIEIERELKIKAQNECKMLRHLVESNDNVKKENIEQEIDCMPPLEATTSTEVTTTETATTIQSTATTTETAPIMPIMPLLNGDLFELGDLENLLNDNIEFNVNGYILSSPEPNDMQLFPYQTDFVYNML